MKLVMSSPGLGPLLGRSLGLLLLTSSPFFFRLPLFFESLVTSSWDLAFSHCELWVDGSSPGGGHRAAAWLSHCLAPDRGMLAKWAAAILSFFLWLCAVLFLFSFLQVDRHTKFLNIYIYVCVWVNETKKPKKQ